MIFNNKVFTVFTFPGMIIYNLIYQILCGLLKLPVYEVKYFKLDFPFGYVMHEETKNPFKIFVLYFGPFILCNLFAIIFIIPVAIEVVLMSLYDDFLSMFQLWIGFAMLVHSFPSLNNLDNFKKYFMENKEVNFFIKLIIFPFHILLAAGSIGITFFLDYLYAVLIIIIIANLIPFFL